MKVNTNISANRASNSLEQNERAFNKSIERLSTGLKLNSAVDDAAGLAITSRMTSQINSLRQAVRNANDAAAMLKTAEGAMVEVTNMLQRMRELCIQSLNDTNTASDRAALNLEYEALKSQIDKISEYTQWNGGALLNGEGFDGPATFHIGANANQTISIDLDNVKTTTLGDLQRTDITTSYVAHPNAPPTVFKTVTSHTPHTSSPPAGNETSVLRSHPSSAPSLSNSRGPYFIDHDSADPSIAASTFFQSHSSLQPSPSAGAGLFAAHKNAADAPVASSDGIEYGTHPGASDAPSPVIGSSSYIIHSQAPPPDSGSIEYVDHDESPPVPAAVGGNYATHSSPPPTDIDGIDYASHASSSPTVTTSTASFITHNSVAPVNNSSTSYATHSSSAPSAIATTAGYAAHASTPPTELRTIEYTTHGSSAPAAATTVDSYSAHISSAPAFVNAVSYSSHASQPPTMAITRSNYAAHASTPPAQTTSNSYIAHGSPAPNVDSAFGSLVSHPSTPPLVANTTIANIGSDLDGDGDIDMVTGGANQATAIRLNDGTGSFGADIAAGNYGSGAGAIALGDIDSDGDIDLITAGTGQYTSIRLNDGSGGFSADIANSNYGSGAQSIALGDIDNDGDLDLLTTAANQHLQIRLNDGSGNFGADIAGSNYGFGAETIALGDIDSDGDIDLMSSGVSLQTEVRLNDGAGGFGTDTAAGSLGGGAGALAFGDIDSDGDLDLLSGGGDVQTQLRLNDGSGTFSADSALGSLGTGAEAIGLGDIDLDGDLDVITAAGQLQTQIRTNHGNATFGTALTYTNLGSGAEALATSPAQIANGFIDFNNLNLSEGDRITISIAGGSNVQGTIGSDGLDTLLTSLASGIAAQNNLFGAASSSGGKLTIEGLSSGEAMAEVTVSFDRPLRQSIIDFSDRNLVQGDRVTLTIAGGTDVQGVVGAEGLDSLLTSLAGQLSSQSALFSDATVNNGVLTLTGLADASAIASVTPAIKDGIVNSQLDFSGLSLAEGDKITLDIAGGSQVQQIIGSDGLEAAVGRLAADIASQSSLYSSASATGTTISMSAVTALTSLPSMTVTLQDGVDQGQINFNGLNLVEGDRVTIAVDGGTDVQAIVGSGGIDAALASLVTGLTTQSSLFSSVTQSGGVLTITGPADGAAMAGITATLEDGAVTSQIAFSGKNLTFGDRLTIMLDDGSQVQQVIGADGLDGALTQMAQTLKTDHSDLLSSASATAGILSLEYDTSLTISSSSTNATAALENAIFKSEIDFSNSSLVGGDRIVLDLGGGIQVEGILGDTSQLDTLLNSMASEIASQTSVVGGAIANNGKIIIDGLADGTVPQPTTQLQNGTLFSELDFGGKNLLEGDRITLAVAGGTQVQRTVGSDGLSAALNLVASDLAAQSGFYSGATVEGNVIKMTGAADIAVLPAITVSLEDSLEEMQLNFSDKNLIAGDKITLPIAGGTQVEGIVGPTGLDALLSTMATEIASQSSLFDSATASNGSITITGLSDGKPLPLITPTLQNGTTTSQINFNGKNLVAGDRITLDIPGGNPAQLKVEIGDGGLDAALNSLANDIAAQTNLYSIATASGGVLNMTAPADSGTIPTITVTLENSIEQSVLDFSSKSLVAGDKITLSIPNGSNVNVVIGADGSLDTALNALAADIAAQNTLFSSASASSGSLTITGLTNGNPISSVTAALDDGLAYSAIDFKNKSLIAGDRITLDIAGGSQVQVVISSDGDLNTALNSLAADIAAQNSLFSAASATGGVLKVTAVTGSLEVPALTVSLDNAVAQQTVDFSSLTLVQGDKIKLDLGDGVKIEGIVDDPSALDTLLGLIASEIATQSSVVSGATASNGSITITGLSDGTALPTITPTLQNGTTYSSFDFSSKSLLAGDKITLSIPGGVDVNAVIGANGDLDAALNSIASQAKQQDTLYSNASVNSGVLKLEGLANSSSIPTATVGLEDRVDQAMLDFSGITFSEGDRIRLTVDDGSEGGIVLQAVLGDTNEPETVLGKLATAITAETAHFSSASVNSGVITMTGLTNGNPISSVTAALDDGLVYSDIDFTNISANLVAGDRISLTIADGSQDGIVLQSVVGNDGNIAAALNALATDIRALDTLFSDAKLTGSSLRVTAVTGSTEVPGLSVSLENAVRQSEIDFNSLGLVEGDKITLTVPGGSNVERVIDSNGLDAALTAMVLELASQDTLFSAATTYAGVVTLTGLENGTPVPAVTVSLDDGVQRGQLDFSNKNLAEGDRITITIDGSIEIQEVISSDGVGAMLTRLSNQIEGLTSLYSGVNLSGEVITMDAVTASTQLPTLTVALETGIQQSQLDFNGLNIAKGDRITLTVPGGTDITQTAGEGGLIGLLNALTAEISAQSSLFSNASHSAGVINIVGLADGSAIPQVTVGMEENYVSSDYDFNNLNLGDGDRITLTLEDGSALYVDIGSNGLETSLGSLAGQISSHNTLYSGAESSNGVLTVKATLEDAVMPSLTIELKNAVNSSQIDFSNRNLIENDRIRLTLADNTVVMVTVGADGIDAAVNELAGLIEDANLYGNVTSSGGLLSLEESVGYPSAADLIVELEKLITTTPNSISSTDISSFENTVTAMERIDNGIYQIDLRRASYGATMTRLEFAADNLANVVMNTSQARGRIQDTDYAAETAEMARTQIIQQAATGILTQANMQAQEVLKLVQ